ncbi:MAG: hypothetical protein V1788_00820 [Nanoarchaeota archaeon]
MKSRTKTILIFEGIFLVIALLYLFFSTAPRQLYPIQGMTVSEQDFSFEIENSDTVMLSRDNTFENYVILRGGEEITLPPGTYFWKVKGNFRESEVKNFTIESKAGLSIKEKDGKYEIENSGNVDLNVTKNNSLVSFSTLINVGDSNEFEKDNSTYTGGQA